MSFLIWILSFTSPAEALNLQLPPNVSLVASVDGPYDGKSGNRIRHRLSVKNDLGGEGPQYLVFEKFSPGKEGNPDQILFSKEIAVTELPKVKELIGQIEKKSVEATYGCCTVSGVRWKGYQVRFNVRRDKKTFICESTEFNDSTFKIQCEE